MPKTVHQLYVDQILVGPRHRKLDLDKVQSLADSMKAISLQTPISVYRASDQIHLVAGHHRLEAAKLLGWGEIDCIFVPLSETDRDLWEIDENLCRKELSVAETRECVKRREALWKQQKEAETNNGTPCPIKRGRGRPTGFATETAKKIGKSKRTINRLRAKPKPKKQSKVAPASEVVVDDELADQSRFRAGLLFRAQEAIEDAQYEDWSRYEVDAEMVEAAKNVIRAWDELFRYLDGLHYHQTRKATEPTAGAEEAASIK